MFVEHDGMFAQVAMRFVTACRIRLQLSLLLFVYRLEGLLKTESSSNALRNMLLESSLNSR